MGVNLQVRAYFLILYNETVSILIFLFMTRTSILTPVGLMNEIEALFYLKSIISSDHLYYYGPTLWLKIGKQSPPCEYTVLLRVSGGDRPFPVDSALLSALSSSIHHC